MKNKFVVICLLGLSLLFSSCLCFEESEEEFYSRNPYCAFYFHNQTNRRVFVRADGKYDDGKEVRWICQKHKEIKAGALDSLCILTCTPMGVSPKWIDVKRNTNIDSLLVSVFNNFEDMAGYEVGMDNVPVLKQYLFVVEEMEPTNSMDIFFEE